jgi:E3 ubiquitin-protein ligase HUWE1
MLLNTFDIDVLQQVLHFMIRPAQRINNPKAIRTSFVVPQDRIIELARGWSNVQVDLLRIAQDLEVTPKMMTLNIQFYRTNNAESPSNESTTTTEGNQVIQYLITDEDLEKDDIDIYTKLVKKFDVPKEYHYELANRIRIAKHMKETEIRRQLLGIRILAITIMCKLIHLFVQEY